MVLESWRLFALSESICHSPKYPLEVFSLQLQYTLSSHKKNAWWAPQHLWTVTDTNTHKQMLYFWSFVNSVTPLWTIKHNFRGLHTHVQTKLHVEYYKVRTQYGKCSFGYICRLTEWIVKYINMCDDTYIRAHTARAEGPWLCWQIG